MNLALRVVLNCIDGGGPDLDAALIEAVSADEDVAKHAPMVLGFLVADLALTAAQGDSDAAKSDVENWLRT